MGVSMNLHGGSWEEYDAVVRPEIVADDGSCRWKWLMYGDTMLAFHEPRDPRPKLTVEPALTLAERGGELADFDEECRIATVAHRVRRAELDGGA